MKKIPHRGNQIAAFTLIELLVVVAIIAVLMSILLPSLGKARQLSRTAVCGTNLRSINQSMQLYASEFGDAILGNAHTSSAFLFNGTFTGMATGMGESNCPNVISSFDWLSPTAKEMGLSFNEGPVVSDRVDRFMKLNSSKMFTCPENDIASTFYEMPTQPVHPLISYNTALAFQYTNGSPHFDNGVDQVFFQMGGYRPMIRLVGKPSEKVYMADGGRWSDGTVQPDDNISILGTSPGGLSADWGPEDFNTRAFNRGTVDGRVYSMRHGMRKSGSTLAGFKFNLSFFDGHVDTMNGLEGADPSLWFPKGSTPSISSEYISSNDFTNRYPHPTIR